MEDMADTHHLLEEKEILQIRHNKHPKRKNNIIVAAMYDAYKGGMSLADIAKLYSKTRQSVYDTFHTRGYPLRSKKLAGAVVIDGVRYSLIGKGYLRGTKDGKRVHLHTVVWEKAYGPIPANHQMHFKDGDRSNCALTNLELIPLKSLYILSAGRNQ